MRPEFEVFAGAKYPQIPQIRGLSFYTCVITIENIAFMENEIAYQEALDYLYSFIDYSLTRSFRYSQEKFNLDRVVVLLERLGNPHKSYPIIHVAGTKGKGSVSALCASALRAAGLRTGLYTSPHLEDYCERIQVDGAVISHAEMVELVAEIKPHVAVVPGLTSFELTTAIGFLYFARKGVEAAVIEVGLGGRLDATNVVTPLVAVIASLSYDHVAVLGNTLTAIAGEKGGIIKPGVPVVLAPQKDEARKVIRTIASERHSRLLEIGQDFLYAPVCHSLDNQSLWVWRADEQDRMNELLDSSHTNGCWQPLSLTIPLLGLHQVENATTAYAALVIAREEGLTLTDEEIKKGFASVFWPGRFEIMQKEPPVIIDSAHNRDSALKLRLALDDYFPSVPIVLLFGASEDKDIEGMFAELLPRVNRVVATQSIHPRAIEAEMLVALAHKFGCPAKAVLPVEEAFTYALSLAGEKAAVVVSGSLFIAAAARSVWMQMDPVRRQSIRYQLKGNDR